MNGRRGKWLALAVSLLISFAAASIGALASVSAQPFYASLNRPSWAPPAYLFGPVWTVLYILMAISAWMIWLSDSPSRRKALTIYGIQLVLNALWSWIFFSWHAGAAAMIEIVILWFAIVATIVLFMRIRRIAGVMLLPYLAWVTFASALTWSVWRNTPEVLG